MFLPGGERLARSGAEWCGTECVEADSGTVVAEFKVNVSGRGFSSHSDTGCASAAVAVSRHTGEECGETAVTQPTNVVSFDRAYICTTGI